MLMRICTSSKSTIKDDFQVCYTSGVKKILYLALLALLLGISPAALAKAEVEILDSSPLKVGIQTAPPFVFKQNGVWRGLSIDLWQAMAKQMKQPYAYVAFPSLAELLKATEQGDVDVVVGAISITPDRETRLDFSHPFMQGGPAIATRQGKDNLLGNLYALLNLNLLKALSALAGIIFLFGFLIWFFERKHNAVQYGGHPIKGIGEGFWWSAVTMTTVGYGDKAPVTFMGRTLAIIWMFLGVILISSFTAAITSSITIQHFTSQVTGVSDLPGLRVSSVAGSSSSFYLNALNIQHQTFPNAQAALKSLQQGNADAVVYDRAILQYLLKDQAESDLQILPETLLSEYYAFALPEQSIHREAINRVLLQEINSPNWQNLLQTYLN